MTAAFSEKVGSITAIEIEELFGRYSYKLNVPENGDGEQSRLMLLYGDNGVGKTTVLRLVWNLLSPAISKGHRTYLARTSFKELIVRFSSNLSISVEKIRGHVGPMVVVVRDSRKKIIVQTMYETDGETAVKAELTFDMLNPPRKHRSSLNERHRSWSRQDSYQEFLEGQNFPGPLFLADDRVLHSDLLAEADARDEALEYTATMLAGERFRKDRITATVTLERAVRNAADALRALAFGGQRSGVAGGQNAYLDVLRQLGRTQKEDVGESEAYERVVQRIGLLAEQNERYAEFDLVPKFDADVFLNSLKRIPKIRRGLAVNIVEPFVESLDQRLSGLRAAESVTREFLRQANKFLRDKQVYFRMREGITVRAYATSEPIKLSALSSGERHLMLLLCSTLLARDRFSLFIIDEPELSLNVIWQRSVMQSLLRLTEGTNVQFIAATHSIEMISRNKPSLVRLRSEDLDGRAG